MSEQDEKQERNRGLSIGIAFLVIAVLLIVVEAIMLRFQHSNTQPTFRRVGTVLVPHSQPNTP